MYKIFYNSNEFTRCKTLEDAVALALGMHNSSNVEHSIKVYCVNEDNCIIEFTRIPDQPSNV